ncbi:MAG: sulfite exporter TauE/SafE family protein [Devosiaceae bacterium]
MMDALLTAFADLNWGTVALAATIFFLAGIIKGVVGFGMPLFAISLLALVMPLTTAIAANVGPSLTTNVRQAFRGPYLIGLIKRLWPFLIPAIGLIWFGIAIQLRINEAYAGFALGVLAVSYALLTFFKVHLTLTSNQEKPVGFVLGIFNGFITGITGIFIIPGGLYLQSLGLKRDELVQALGLLFMLSTGMIGIVFGIKALMTPTLLLLSLMCIPPAFAGLAIGERLRSRLSEAMFAKLFLVGIAVLGVSLIIRNGSTLLAGG